MSQGTRGPRAKAPLAAAVGTSPGSPGHRSEQTAGAGGHFGTGAGEGHVAAQERLASQSQEKCGARSDMGPHSVLRHKGHDASPPSRAQAWAPAQCQHKLPEASGHFTVSLMPRSPDGEGAEVAAGP